MKLNLLVNLPKRMVHFINERLLYLGVLMTLFLSSALALADDPSINDHDLGQVAQKIQGQALVVKEMIGTVAQASGFALALYAAFMWKKASANKESHGRAFLVFLIGCVLFFLPQAMGIGASSLLGS